MKARMVILALVIVAFLAGFFTGWKRAISLIGCPQTESERLQAELDQVHAQIKLANQKNAEIKKKHLEAMKK